MSGSWSFLPDNDRTTLCRWDPWTELLQVHHISRRELEGYMGSRPSQPAVVWWGWGFATATHLAGPLQTDTFSTLHHGTQFQHQGVCDQLLRSALARHLWLQWEHSRPREHLRERKKYGYSRLFLWFLFIILCFILRVFKAYSMFTLKTVVCK